jgi:mannosyl-glycoprotein endo-beta-N-acetylglucosaminidase
MKKFKALIILLIISLCCAGIAFAEQNDSDVTDSDAEVEIDDSAYTILVSSISGNEIKFNDGFTGYCLDLGKDKIEKTDKFMVGSSSNGNVENLVKLAIIECYKQGKEASIDKIVSKIVANNLDSSDDVIKEVLNSNDKVSDMSTVKIDNTTEATFNFEILTPFDNSKSDCLAYTVSMRTVENDEPSTDDDVIGTAADSSENLTEDNDDKTKADNTDDATQKDNNTKEDVKKDNNTDDKKDASDKKAKDNSTGDEDVNETNKTIVTNTKITVENNTTIVYKNNVKTVNQTAPEDNTVDDLLNTAGNPIFILVVVIAVALIAVAFMKRKD